MSIIVNLYGMKRTQGPLSLKMDSQYVHDVMASKDSWILSTRVVASNPLDIEFIIRDASGADATIAFDYRLIQYLGADYTMVVYGLKHLIEQGTGYEILETDSPNAMRVRILNPEDIMR